MKRGERGVLALASLVLLLCPGIALAQDHQEARRLFESGVEAMDRQAYAEAASRFDASYSVLPRASTACNMAVAQERMSQVCAAIDWYRACHTLEPQGPLGERATSQMNVLAPQCQRPPEMVPPNSNGASGTSAGPAPANPGTSEHLPIRIVERQGSPNEPAETSSDHLLLGLGLGAIGLGAGALVGGILAAQAAQDEAGQIIAPSGELPVDSMDAEHYRSAATLSNVALGLYVGAGVLGALGTALTVVDLVVLGGSSERAAQTALRLRLAGFNGGGGLSIRGQF